MAIVKIDMGKVYVQTPDDLESIEFCIKALQFFYELFGGKKKCIFLNAALNVNI